MHKKLWILWIIILTLGCNKSRNGNQRLGEFGNKICQDDICVDDIQELDGDFLVSPVEIDMTGQDSQGTMISSNTVLVIFWDGTELDEIERIIEEIDGKISAYISGVSVYQIRFEFDSAEMVENKIRDLIMKDAVEFAERNYLLFPENLDIEAAFGILSESWGYETIQLAEAYAFLNEQGISLDRGVKVAVLDCSFDTDHEELRGQFLPGLNFADMSTDIYVIGPHGTAVSSVIAGRNDEILASYFSGVAPLAKIIPYMVFGLKGDGCYGVNMGTVALAMMYAKKEGAQVINMSLGGYGDFVERETLEIVVRKLHEADIVIVASAGNNDQDAADHFPSNMRHIISVGATVKYGLDETRASFSNYSLDNSDNILTLAAPGQDVLIAVPQEFANDRFSLMPNGNFESLSGTSLAAPFVAGLATLLKSIKPDLSANRVRQIMIDSADEIIVTNGAFHLWKRINVLKAVKMLVKLVQSENIIIGQLCRENNECPDGSFCSSFRQCTVLCFDPEEADRAPMTCGRSDNCNDFWNCPSGTFCIELKIPNEYEMYGLGYKMCLPTCINNSDCYDGLICWKHKYESFGICILGPEIIRDRHRGDPCGEIIQDFDDIVCPDNQTCYSYRNFEDIGYCDCFFDGCEVP